jgi:hypothetical protein
MTTIADQVFGWADRMSDYTQRLHRARELSAAIRDGENRCGSCQKWLIDDCPRERRGPNGQKLGGPSCQAIKCDQFAMKDWDARRVEGLKAELADVRAKLGGAA